MRPSQIVNVGSNVRDMCTLNIVYWKLSGWEGNLKVWSQVLTWPHWNSIKMEWGNLDLTDGKKWYNVSVINTDTSVWVQSNKTEYKELMWKSNTYNKDVYSLSQIKYYFMSYLLRMLITEIGNY